jgi:hypothetical protein
MSGIRTVKMHKEYIEQNSSLDYYNALLVKGGEIIKVLLGTNLHSGFPRKS